MLHKGLKIFLAFWAYPYAWLSADVLSLHATYFLYILREKNMLSKKELNEWTDSVNQMLFMHAPGQNILCVEICYSRSFTFFFQTLISGQWSITRSSVGNTLFKIRHELLLCSSIQQ